MFTFIILGIVALFIIYLVLDFLLISPNPNAFIDKWLKKTLWLWLPFYALWKLTKEIMSKYKQIF